MEARNFLSTVGGAGALRLWRAEVCFLSASFVDVGRAAERDFSLDDCRQCVHLDRSGGGRGFDVSAGAAMARPARCDFCSGTLCRQSVSPGDCVLAEFFRGAVSCLPGAITGAARAGSRGGAQPGNCAVGTGPGRCVADQRSGCGDDSLLVGAADCVLRVEAALPETSAGSSGSCCPGCVPVSFLSTASNLRAEVDQHCTGSLARIATAG